jgi:hypothetical protein
LIGSLFSLKEERMNVWFFSGLLLPMFYAAVIGLALARSRRRNPERRVPSLWRLLWPDLSDVTLDEKNDRLAGPTVLAGLMLQGPLLILGVLLGGILLWRGSPFGFAILFLLGLLPGLAVLTTTCIWLKILQLRRMKSRQA